VNQFFEWVYRIVASWKFWLVVPPWDIGVRVRLGKVAATLTPGLHFRIPGLDEIILVNTRLRLAGTPTVTIPGSRDNKARVITGQVAFFITDPVKALLAYTYPTDAIAALAQSCIAGGGTADEALARLKAEFGGTGINVTAVYYTENVEVRTFRFLMNGGGGVYSGASHPVGLQGPNAPQSY
jgi:hypothetical protein